MKMLLKHNGFKNEKEIAEQNKKGLKESAL
jgi:hypothetical protein